MAHCLVGKTSKIYSLGLKKLYQGTDACCSPLIPGTTGPLNLTGCSNKSSPKPFLLIPCPLQHLWVWIGESVLWVWTGESVAIHVMNTTAPHIFGEQEETLPDTTGKVPMSHFQIGSVSNL